MRDRVLHEIYMPGFNAATIQAGAASVMCSYASLHGTFDCENRRLLTGVLDHEWGYHGFVRSDGGANHSTVASVNAGLDQEKGSDYWDHGRLAAAVAHGRVSMATINHAARRILTPMFRLGLFNHPPTGSLSDVVTTAKHAAFARTVAERGTVLLKNARRALPLRRIRSIAVIGPDGGSGAYTAGGGSSHVIPPYVVTPCRGIKARAGSKVKVTCPQGAPASGSLQTAPAQKFTVPETGTYQFSLTSQGPGRLTVGGHPIISPSSPHSPPGPGLTTKTGSIGLTAGRRVPVIAGYAPAAGTSSPSSASLNWQVLVSPGQARSMRAAAAKAAARSKAAIVFVNKTESEGRDLTSIGLPGGQNQLIRAVAAANPDTIVVLNTGGPVTMPWLSQVKSVLEAWYPGQEDGNAIAALLFGDVDPSGHLPETFPKSLSQVPAHAPARWPGVGGRVKYSEGLDVGYRWYDAKHIAPLFPFGFGLSYTRFSFSHLHIWPSSTTSHGKVRVAATVTNIGIRTGAEVAQLYLADPAADREPPRQLKGFRRVTLGPGKSARVRFTLTPTDLSYWNSRAGTWAAAHGTYRVMVGDSSAIAGLPLRGSFHVK